MSLMSQPAPKPLVMLLINKTHHIIHIIATTDKVTVKYSEYNSDDVKRIIMMDIAVFRGRER